MKRSDLPDNYTDNPEAIIKRNRAKLKKVHSSQSLSSSSSSELGVSTDSEDQSRVVRSLTPEFEAMVEKSLREFPAPTTDNIHTGPTVNVGDGSFELKPALINMVQSSQFCGKTHEDASAHLQNFPEICSTFTIKGVTRDAILLRLFPFSLLGRAKQWFYANKDKNTTWAICSTNFLTKFFPVGKTNALRGKISSFQQHNDETIPESWLSFVRPLLYLPVEGNIDCFWARYELHNQLKCSLLVAPLF